MPKKRKITSLEFGEKLAKVVKKHLSKLPEAEQESRVRAFERAVARLRRGAASTTRHTSETRPIPLVAQERE